MKQWMIIVAMFAGVCGVATSMQPTARADDDVCSVKGKCPLHDWMQSEMDAAVDKEDAKALASAFDTLVGWAPDPAWNTGAESWSKLSKEGAALAKAGDIAGARKLCKSCHKAFRNKYKEAFRSKALPK